MPPASITVQDNGQPVTVVAFCGLAPQNNMFEWAKSFRDLPCNFVGVKDPAEDWYYRHFTDLACQVQDASRGTRRVFIGGSAGGFAALKFGRVLGADKVIAFGPQSASGATKRALGDMRWPEHCRGAGDCDVAGKHPNATVYYATDDDLDVMHARRLDCTCEAYPKGGHDLAHRLKDRGLLADILRGAL